MSMEAKLKPLMKACLFCRRLEVLEQEESRREPLDGGGVRDAFER